MMLKRDRIEHLFPQIIELLQEPLAPRDLFSKMIENNSTEPENTIRDSIWYLVATGNIDMDVSGKLYVVNIEGDSVQKIRDI